MVHLIVTREGPVESGLVKTRSCPLEVAMGCKKVEAKHRASGGWILDPGSWI